MFKPRRASRAPQGHRMPCARSTFRPCCRPSWQLGPGSWRTPWTPCPEREPGPPGPTPLSPCSPAGSRTCAGHAPAIQNCREKLLKQSRSSWHINCLRSFVNWCFMLNYSTRSEEINYVSGRPSKLLLSHTKIERITLTGTILVQFR